MQNDWILLNQNLVINQTNTTLLALQIFETYLDNAYILPDSDVFLFQKIDIDVWEIWNSFRFSKSDTIRVFKIGSASPNYLEMNDLYTEKRDFCGITLKANTVVCKYLYSL